MEKRYDDVVSLAAAAAAVIVIRRRRRRRLQHIGVCYGVSRGCKQEIVTVECHISSIMNLKTMHQVSLVFLRMPSEVFRELLAVVAPRITKSNTFMRDSICAEDMLTVTLRYLASCTITWINPS